MKIHSAYLQNQIPEGTKPVRPIQDEGSDQVNKVPGEQPSRQTNRLQPEKDRLELSEESKRILSSSEKKVFAQLYQDYQLQHNQTYSRGGEKTGHQESEVGKKIDVKC